MPVSSILADKKKECCLTPS